MPADYIHHFRVDFSTNGTSFGTLVDPVPPGDGNVSEFVFPMPSVKTWYRLWGFKAMSGLIEYNDVIVDIGETVLPAGQMTAPAENSTLSGNVTLSAHVTDNVGLQKVEFYVYVNSNWVLQGTVSASGTSDDVSFLWNSNSVLNGPKFIAAKVYDTSNNSQWTSYISVNINNVNLDPGTISWARTLGHVNASGECWGKAACVDAAGNVFVTGKFSSGSAQGVTFGAPQNPQTHNPSGQGFNVFVAKYNSSGTMLWMFPYGSTFPDEGASICVDSAGNPYVTGTFSGTINFGKGNLNHVGVTGGLAVFVAKFNKDTGACLWSIMLDGNQGGNAGNGIVSDGTNVFVAGVFNIHMNFNELGEVNTNNLQGFVVKLNGSTGVAMWKRNWGTAGLFDATYNKGVAVDSEGNVVVCGYTYGACNFGDGAKPWTGGSDFYVAKFRGTDGFLFWANVYGGLDQQGNGASDTAEAVCCRGTTVYVCGTFRYTVNLGNGVILASTAPSNMFVAAWNGSGVAQWKRHVSADGPTPTIAAWDIDVDSSGNLVVTGNASGEVNFSDGLTMAIATVFVLKLSTTATDSGFIYKRRYASTGWCAGWGVAISPVDRSIVLIGYQQGDTTFTPPDTVLSSIATTVKDAYLVKTTP